MTAWKVLGALYIAQAITGALIGFTIPWLRFYGVL